MDKIGCYQFLAEPFHCDFSQRLFMGHLGNHMLNAADFHSTDRGFGMKYLMTIQRSWVLSRLAIEMDEMPQMYTKFNVETWVESAMRFFTSRNFRVVGEDGKVYGYGRSIWAMIDTESRQPTDIFAIDNGAINNWIVKDKECPIDKGGRVKMDDSA
ncbi:MAG: acyl-[Prevotella sp.]|nr:acyl-[acyl-carrier-protein] thioesterase [Prevotella sp.]